MKSAVPALTLMLLTLGTFAMAKPLQNDTPVLKLHMGEKSLKARQNDVPACVDGDGGATGPFSGTLRNAVIVVRFCRD